MREKQEETGLWKSIEKIAQLNFTSQAESDLGKGRANIWFETSQGMNGKTRVPREKPISWTQLLH